MIEKFNEYLLMLDNRKSYRIQIISYVRQYLKEYNTLSMENISNFLNGKNNQANIYRYLKKYAEFLHYKKKISNDLLQEIHSLKRLKKIVNKKPKRTVAINGTEIDLKHKWKVSLNRWNYCYSQMEYETQRIAIWLGFNFGLRSNEIVNLEWKHINFEYNSLAIRETETHELKTENASRTLRMTPTQKQVLEDYRTRTKDLDLLHDFVIYIPIGKNRHSYINENVFYDWCSKVKLQIIVQNHEIERKLRPHVLRYSFATIYFEKHGVRGLYTLSKILGHKDIRTTQIYLAIDEKDLEQDMLEGMLALNL